MASKRRSPRSLLIVGPNRPLFAWALGVSAVLAIAGGVLTVTGVVDMELQDWLIGAPAGAAGGCIAMLLGGNRLAYSAQRPEAS